MMDAKRGRETALGLFKANYNCSQSTLAGALDSFGKGYGSRLDLAVGFQSGIAQTGRLCGCLSGIIMAAGLIVPRRQLGLQGWKQKVSDVSKEIIGLFEEEFGHFDCSGLAGCDMSDAANRARFLIEEGGRQRVCEPMVARSVELAAALLDLHRARRWK